MKTHIIALLIGSALLVLNLADAKSCSYDMGKESLQVTWKAYKTPLKIDVGGTFDAIVYTPKKKRSDDLKGLLVGNKVTIDTHSVNSNNKGRDQKLVHSFFKHMKNETISATIVKVTQKHLIVRINMNGIAKEVPMTYTLNDGMLHAQGVIDLFDFQASQALQSINKACFKLHQGKTWNDVSIGFDMKIDCTQI